MEASSTANPAALRLLWLTETYPPDRGGMAASCDRIVYGLRRAGVRVDLAHFARPKRLRRETVETQMGGRYLAVPSGADPAHTLHRMWNLLRRPEAQARYTHVVAFGGALPLLAGPAFAAWLGAPLVTLLRGNDFDAGLFMPKRRAVLADALERSARVGVVCREHGQKIRALFPRCRPVWIPNGLDFDAWEPLASDLAGAAAWRAAVVEPGRRVLGLFGHLKPKKGASLLLEALLGTGLAGRFHLLFVGDVTPHLLDVLETHEREFAYSLHPFLDRYALLRRYPACDLVAIPSLYDGLPNVLLEAAALGLPFVATTAGGMADVLRDGDHGFLCHPGDRSGLMDALHRAAAATDDDLRRMGEAARAAVRRDFTHERETQRYLDLFADGPPVRFVDATAEPSFT